MFHRIWSWFRQATSETHFPWVSLHSRSFSRHFSQRNKCLDFSTEFARNFQKRQLFSYFLSKSSLMITYLFFAWFQFFCIKIMNETQDGSYAVFIRLKKWKMVYLKMMCFLKFFDSKRKIRQYLIWQNMSDNSQNRNFWTKTDEFWPIKEIKYLRSHFVDKEYH